MLYTGPVPVAKDGPWYMRETVYNRPMYVSVRAVAGAKRESVEALTNNRLKISVKEPAKQNVANRRILELVALHFSLPANKVRLVSGHASPAKLFSLDIEE